MFTGCCSKHAHVLAPYNPSGGRFTCIQGVEFWAVNTDSQALSSHSALNKVQIGTELTRGLGCGGMPERGRLAAEESEEALRKMVQVSGQECIR